MFRRFASFVKSHGVKHYSDVVTKKERGKIITLTIEGEDQHWLTPDLCNSLRSQLDCVKRKGEATSGSVLITTAKGKNFCTGFPQDGYDKVVEPFRELVKDLISLPMPTIAAVNGSATSAGLILAISHDHMTMEPDNLVLTMEELDNKMPFPDYFAAMIRSKVVPRAFARLALNTLPFNSEHAEHMGLAVYPREGEYEEPLPTAKRLARHLSKDNWDGNMYAEIRKTLYPDLCNVLGLSCAPSSRL